MDSEEFSRWVAYMAIEPPMELRVDYLSGALAAMIGRVEATLGGKPPRLGARMIEWDKRPEDDAAAFAAWASGINKPKCRPKSQPS